MQVPEVDNGERICRMRLSTTLRARRKRAPAMRHVLNTGKRVQGRHREPVMPVYGCLFMSSGK